ncbi:HAD-IA family hydrolase [Micromonospora sp. STR1_7]|uniref:HAD-IA family hydrolase n=1 Tax=Micromonospora parastrephiae TaxID=2806101 RepID=A0ABS1Y033_9ACTN|nr:HAD-IA family hydrolase [Micromonospora parastrephiae]MBM0234876.1 HAD-IA family hydrolase [Micromonospora parastrephiae]
MTDKRPIVNALVLDMDNTLYDWVAYFVPAVRAMVTVAAKLLAVSEDELRGDLRFVHRTHGNTEHPFALLETAAVERQMPAMSQRARHEHLLPAFAAFNEVRRNHLRLYQGVESTLRAVKATGCRIVGHTEAKDVNISSRARALGLESMLEAVYAPRFVGPPHPLGVDRRSTPAAIEVCVLPPTARKPNPDIARRIAEQLNVPPARCLYVGDNLSKDVVMAKRAGMLAAWARYGTHHDPELWRDLVALSHWEATAVSAAESTGDDSTRFAPDVTLDAFYELLDHYAFAPDPQSRQSQMASDCLATGPTE